MPRCTRPAGRHVLACLQVDRVSVVEPRQSCPSGGSRRSSPRAGGGVNLYVSDLEKFVEVFPARAGMKWIRGSWSRRPGRATGGAPG